MVLCCGCWPNTTNTITPREGKATGYSSQKYAKNETRSATRLSVGSDSVACSNITGAPHEYFYQTRSVRAKTTHPNRPPTGVFLVPKLKFFAKIFRLYSRSCERHAGYEPEGRTFESCRPHHHF